jgi:hypothetical protein
MANLNIHPAPGLGDLTQGFYVVPQNPLQFATEGVSRVTTLGELLAGSFVVPQNPFYSYSTGQVQPIGQGAAGTPMTKKMKGGGAPSLGDLVNGNYVVPQNVFRVSGGTTGMSGLGDADGCGCGGSCGGCGGMGDLTADFTQISTDFSAGNYTNILSDTIASVPVWVYLAGVAALAFMSSSSSSSSSGGSRRRR